MKVFPKWTLNKMQYILVPIHHWLDVNWKIPMLQSICSKWHFEVTKTASKNAILKSWKIKQCLISPNLILPFSADPYETNNLAPQKRDVVLRLMSRLAAFEATMIPPGSISFSLVQICSDWIRFVVQNCLELVRFGQICPD